MAVFEVQKSSNDDEVVASDVPLRYLSSFDWDERQRVVIAIEFGFRPKLPFLCCPSNSLLSSLKKKPLFHILLGGGVEPDKMGNFSRESRVHEVVTHYYIRAMERMEKWASVPLIGISSRVFEYGREKRAAFC